jgi:hypothetical protein
MHRHTTLVVFALTAVLAVAFTASGQSSDSWTGTWKVNLAKSKYVPGPAPTNAATVKMEASANGLKTAIDGVNAQGQTTHTVTNGKFDGKDYPTEGAQAPNSTQALERIDDHTFQTVGKVDGKVTVTTRVVISSDGKTLTATQTGKDAQGQTVANVIVADKQ